MRFPLALIRLLSYPRIMTTTLAPQHFGGSSFSFLTDSQKRIVKALRAMKGGTTGAVFGQVVTRWAVDAFEVSSVGRYTETAENAARRISASTVF